MNRFKLFPVTFTFDNGETLTLDIPQGLYDYIECCDGIEFIESESWKNFEAVLVFMSLVISDFERV